MSDLQDERVENLERRVEKLEKELERVTKALAGFIIGLHDVIIVKAAAEDEDAQASFVEALESSLRNNIQERHLEKYQNAVQSILKSVLSTTKNMPADLQLRILSPPPYGGDSERNKKRSITESSDS